MTITTRQAKNERIAIEALKALKPRDDDDVSSCGSNDVMIVPGDGDEEEVQSPAPVTKPRTGFVGHLKRVDTFKVHSLDDEVIPGSFQHTTTKYWQF